MRSFLSSRPIFHEFGRVPAPINMQVGPIGNQPGGGCVLPPTSICHCTPSSVGQSQQLLVGGRGTHTHKKNSTFWLRRPQSAYCWTFFFFVAATGNNIHESRIKCGPVLGKNGRPRCWKLEAPKSRLWGLLLSVDVRKSLLICPVCYLWRTDAFSRTSGGFTFGLPFWPQHKTMLRTRNRPSSPAPLSLFFCDINPSSYQ